MAFLSLSMLALIVIILILLLFSVIVATAGLFFAWLVYDIFKRLTKELRNILF